MTDEERSDLYRLLMDKVNTLICALHETWNEIWHFSTMQAESKGGNKRNSLSVLWSENKANFKSG